MDMSELDKLTSPRQLDLIVIGSRHIWPR